MLLLRSIIPSPLLILSPPPPPPPIFSLCGPTTVHPLSHRRLKPPISAAAGDDAGGPIELSPDTPSVFDEDGEPASPLKVGASVVLFGAITFFLSRSLRRRAQRAKELKFRSSGVKKALKDEALENLKAIGNMSVEPGSPPSPVQTLLGGLTAGVIAIVLYKFATTVEATLDRQVVSDNFSVRQITITVRTIVNGLCYLATFVFGINSIGLFLYSAQLAINSFMEGGTNSGTGSGTETADEKPLGDPNSSPESATSVEEIRGSQSDQISDSSKR